MAGIQLRDYQEDAIRRMHNGCVLCGGVGSGKSRTAIAYYYLLNGGEVNTDEYVTMDDVNIPDLYIITTARKRDTLEWEKELGVFLLSTDKEINLYHNRVVVDSWNNIKKYDNITDAFFIFDEQRVVGSGAWVKSFLKIAKKNKWILLSATPGDKWEDYIPVFVANGFYRNRTEFKSTHLVYAPYSKYPVVTGYLNTGRLIRLRNRILVTMDFKRKTIAHHIDIYTEYDKMLYRNAMKERWNPWKNMPIENVSELCQVYRKIVGTDETRGAYICELVSKHRKCIIFYNFDYELDILRSLYYGEGFQVAEWNSHKHQPTPENDSWVYLVQYNAGAEGWNCISTDTIIFYSENYSYRIMEQAAGRIDRLNTHYTDLYYYHLKSRAPIDLAIARALKAKKNFNESAFVRSQK